MECSILGVKQMDRLPNAEIRSHTKVVYIGNAIWNTSKVGQDTQQGAVVVGGIKLRPSGTQALGREMLNVQCPDWQSKLFPSPVCHG